MKKYVSLLTIGVICFCTSCNTKTEGGLSATAQKNVNSMDSVTKSFETKDFSRLGDFIAADGVDHAGEKGDIKGLDSMKVEFAKSVAEFDNQQTEIIKQLADDDYVMSWERYSGTYTKDGMGHKAGDKLDMKVLELAKFKDGKATEHWSFMEPADVVKIMSSMQPQMSMPMPADSTKTKKKK